MTDDEVAPDLVQSYRAMLARGNARRLSSQANAEPWRRLYRSFCPGSGAADEEKFIRDVADILRCDAADSGRVDDER